MIQKGLTVQFNTKAAEIRRPDVVVLRATKQNNSFITGGKVKQLFVAANDGQSWHNRFGHFNFKSLSELLNKKMVHGMNVKMLPQTTNCRTCVLCKIHVAPFPQESKARPERCMWTF